MTETIVCYKCRNEFEVREKTFETGIVRCPKCGCKQEVILG